MEQYMFQRQIHNFDLATATAERQDMIFERAKHDLWREAQAKIKELLDTGECYAFQLTFLQPPRIDDFQLTVRIVLRLQTQLTNFIPQGVTIPPPHEVTVPFPFDPLALTDVVNADAFQVGQQHYARAGQRMAEQVDEMARNAFIDPGMVDPATLGGDYGIGEMWNHPELSGFDRWLTGKQHEAVPIEDVWSDFPDDEIEAYDFFR